MSNTINDGGGVQLLPFRIPSGGESVASPKPMPALLPPDGAQPKVKLEPALVQGGAIASGGQPPLANASDTFSMGGQPPKIALLPGSRSSGEPAEVLPGLGKPEVGATSGAELLRSLITG